MALLHGWLSITFKTDQIVSGTVINILAVGLTWFMRREVLLSSQAGRDTLQPFNIPVLSNIPVLGDVFFKGQPIFYSMFILLIVTHVVLFYTRWGLRTRAVGENPACGRYARHQRQAQPLDQRLHRRVDRRAGGRMVLAGTDRRVRR